MNWKIFFITFIAGVSITLINANLALEEPEIKISQRYPRQTASIDGCVIGCIISAVQNVGISNFRPSSLKWNIGELLQSAVLRTYCEAYNHATTCINSCSVSVSKLLISALLGVPGIFCTGSTRANECLRNASKSVQNTCDNSCIELKPSFGMSTWMSLTKMSNIFNDICAYWGCQIACGKPAVESQCGQESVSLLNRLSSVGLGTLKEALKSAGLQSVCGANATRVPQTYEIVTDRPTDHDGQIEEGDGERRPPIDNQEGGGDGDGHGGGDEEPAGETGVNLGDQTRSGHRTGGNVSNTTERSPSTGRTGQRGRGSGRGGGSGGGGGNRRPYARLTTTTLSDVDEDANLGNEDYWQTIRGGSGRGQDSRDGAGQRQRGSDPDDDYIPPPRSSGVNTGRDREGATAFSMQAEGLGDLSKKRRPNLVTSDYGSSERSRTREPSNAGRRGSGNQNGQPPTLQVGDVDRRTGEVHLKLNN